MLKYFSYPSLLCREDYKWAIHKAYSDVTSFLNYSYTFITLPFLFCVPIQMGLISLCLLHRWECVFSRCGHNRKSCAVVGCVTYVSRSHSHHSHLSHHQIHTPDPTHLITDHRHRSPVIKSTISTHSSRTVTVWSQTLLAESPEPLTVCQHYHRSCVSLPDLHRLQALLLLLVPRDKVKDWLLTDKTLWNVSIPVSLTWTRCIASFPCHSSINRQLISLTSVYLICWQYDIFVSFN